MSLNMTVGMDQDRVKKYGKLFGTIDFEMNQSISSDIVRSRRDDVHVGEFQIGGKSFPVTYSELDRIIETAELAKSTFVKSYSMGRYGK